MTGTDPTTMRSVLGHFPSGVTIVTGVADGAPAGFTCQSFSSLSLDPPLVLDPPRPELLVLAEDRGDRAVLRQRALRAAGRALHDVREVRDATSSRASSGGPSPLGSPILAGATAWIDCTLYACHDGGDHLIVIGAVHDLAAEPEVPPLVFHRGAYARTEGAFGL